ncbi:ergothioneine biosynthesis protein EgtB [Nevskia sp.]|uniref:ergothioneine biosynthesis protein EgtB n=1 Tax=Nevskia sp. TaxID=1929292 RepID=UPI00260113DD|nr:ergothioneine biosynthesis protein EgtB [Nevskia sp.]
MTPQPSLAHAYARVRAQSRALADGLTPEDCQIQSMADASPVKWHLAHTTWFFETFVLAAGDPQYRPVDSAYRVLFNSYYVGIGERAPRAERGLMTRPTLDEVLRYREIVDVRMAALLASDRVTAAARDVITLGLHHEQQHQELIVTDLKHHFSRNPQHPVYRPARAASTSETVPLRWIGFDAAIHEIGHDGDGFAFDNETPRHRVFAEAFELGSRLVTNEEFAAFIADGGYRRPELWLSDGWDAVQAQDWRAPLYWLDPWLNDGLGDGWHYTLAGRQPRAANASVCHVSYYEAEAYARWAGARLATEAEWEIAAQTVSGSPHGDGSHLDDGHFAPQPAAAVAGLAQMFGDVWEWTQSAYLPYPGFAPAAGAVGEYNGKFMINQMILRGGSCATPQGHVRPSYRNFFPPATRWQFSGIRLARSRR